MPLKQTNWGLVAINPMLDDKSYPTEDVVKAHILFNADGKQVSGSDGCNRYFGAYSQDGQKLTFGMMGTTRMSCPEPRFDVSFHKALALTTKYVIYGDTLELHRHENWLLRFKAQGSGNSGER